MGYRHFQDILGIPGGLGKRVRRKHEMGRLVTPSPNILPRPTIRNQPSLLDSYNEPPILKLAIIAILDIVEGKSCCTREEP